MSENDWDTFTILKKKHYTKQDKKITELKAKRDGNMMTEKKFMAGGNKKNVVNNSRLLDESTDAGKHKKIDKSLSQIIIKARNNKSLSQKQLASLIAEKIDVVTSYEKGTANPNHQILGKMEKHLGVILRGDSKKWGQPLQSKFKKK